MRQRTISLEKAYRYVLRRVDAETKKQAIASVERAKQNERFQFVAWTLHDAMEYFLEKHGSPFVVPADDEISYVKVSELA